MGTDDDKLNQVKRQQKAALTRAKNSGDPKKIVRAVTGAREAFQVHGFPDQWPLWRIAVDDLSWHDNPDVRDMARRESDAWG